MSMPTVIPLINYSGNEVYYPLYYLKSFEIYQINKKYRVRAIVFDSHSSYKDGERLLFIHPPDKEMERDEARNLLDSYIQEYTTDLSHDLMIKMDNFETRMTKMIESITQLTQEVSETHKRKIGNRDEQNGGDKSKNDEPDKKKPRKD